MIGDRRVWDRDEPGERSVRFHVSPAKAREVRAVASSGRSAARSIIRFRQTGGHNLRGSAMHDLWCASVRASSLRAEADHAPLRDEHRTDAGWRRCD